MGGVQIFFRSTVSEHWGDVVSLLLPTDPGQLEKDPRNRPRVWRGDATAELVGRSLTRSYDTLPVKRVSSSEYLSCVSWTMSSGSVGGDPS